METVKEIDEARWPTMAIDLVRSEIVAANAAARAALRLPPQAAFPVGIDSAMPALNRLRALNATGTLKGHRETLVFWWKGRPVASACDIDVPGDGSTPTVATVRLLNGERYALPATFKEAQFDPAPFDPEPRDATPSPQLNGHSGASDIAATPPHEALDATNSDDTQVAENTENETRDLQRIERDDQATLREIARRIRAGQMTIAAERATSEAASVPSTAEQPTPFERDMIDDPEHDQSNNTDREDVALTTTNNKDGGDDQRSDTTPSPQPCEPTQPEDTAAPTVTTVTSTDLSRLAHELKTPLTAIAAAAEVMRDQRLGRLENSRYLEYAGDIHDSAQHALSLITGMLSGADNEPAAPERIINIDLNRICERSVAMLQPLAEKRQITLAFDGDGGRPHVRAPLTPLRQILLNLITNALKFTPTGGDVRCVTGYLDNGAVFLVVRDTGTGIAASEVERARTLAARQSSEADGDPQISERAGGGYGIGLPLVIHLVNRLGAELEIDGTPGRGTVAMITFHTANDI